MMTLSANPRNLVLIRKNDPRTSPDSYREKTKIWLRSNVYLFLGSAPLSILTLTLKRKRV